MIKHIKTILAAFFTMFAVISCEQEVADVNDRLDDLEKRVSALEQLCKEMNSNISSLQGIVTAMQTGDYITSVNPVTSDGKTVGYTITFAKGQPITIYHGQDGSDGKDGTNGKDGKDGKDGVNGQDGKDGADGHTPVICIQQDTDGIWYWTLDGQWLLNGNGQKVKAVGTDGKDGEDGTPGKDGITPQLKIEDGYWYLSYDSGQTWTQLGKAVGENGKDGKDGAIGLTGDSMFTGIDTSSSDYVLFTLIGGTEIKIPTWYAFEQLQALVNQMNSNIEALQTIVTALQSNDYISSISPIVEGGKEVGYIISFTKSGSVTIYHGKDGKDGKDGADGQDGSNGQDGHTPVIGVKQDSDGFWYWTVDGEWLLDSNSQKIKAIGVDGKDGQDGSNGQDGQDGHTPLMGVEQDTDGILYWTIDGEWVLDGNGQKVRAAAQDGKDGKDGAMGLTGDSMFTSIDTSSSDYVVFTLIGGSELKIPTWYAFEQLQVKVNQMNSNIEALQTIVTALQSNDYISSISPIVESGKEVGYIINFTKGGSVTIYHGKDGADGKDGTDGQDGQTPVISVRQDTDGVWFWTVDGEWLLDGNGQKVKAIGLDGKDGQDGSNGQDGQDGITPQLKIEDGYWYVSTDNGQTWSQLGKATGENGKDGEDGVDGKDGDSMFQSVTVSDTEVTFVTSDAQTFVVRKASALSIEFDSADLVLMPVNSTRDIHYTITSGLEDITIEAISSADLKSKVIKTDVKTGIIQVKAGSNIDEYSKVVVLVSNGIQTIMRTLTFEEEAIRVEDSTTKEVSNVGGEVSLEFFSNASCHVVIPEEAQSWISTAPGTKAMTMQTAGLIVQPNTGVARTATVLVQSDDGLISLSFMIQQKGVVATSLTVNKTSVSMKVGESQTLKATVNPENTVLAWTTSDKAIADVYNGVVTAIKPGSVTITVKTENLSAECTVKVSDSSTSIGGWEIGDNSNGSI